MRSFTQPRYGDHRMRCPTCDRWLTFEGVTDEEARDLLAEHRQEWHREAL